MRRNWRAGIAQGRFWSAREARSKIRSCWSGSTWEVGIVAFRQDRIDDAQVAFRMALELAVRRQDLYGQRRKR